MGEARIDQSSKTMALQKSLCEDKSALVPIIMASSTPRIAPNVLFRVWKLETNSPSCLPNRSPPIGLCKYLMLQRGVHAQDLRVISSSASLDNSSMQPCGFLTQRRTSEEPRMNASGSARKPCSVSAYKNWYQALLRIGVNGIRLTKRISVQSILQVITGSLQQRVVCSEQSGSQNSSNSQCILVCGLDSSPGISCPMHQVTARSLSSVPSTE